MAESTATESRADIGRSNGWELIGTGNHARVWRNIDDATVRKTYLTADRSQAARLAEHEFSALKRAATALESIPGVRSPTAHHLDRDGGQVLMEFCPGKPIYEVVGGPAFSDPVVIERVARQLGDAVIVLAETLRQDEIDFSIRNTMISEDFNEVILIDFASLGERAPVVTNASALETALGSFAAGVAIYQIHRKSIVDVTSAGRLRQLTVKLMNHVAAKRDVNIATVRDIAWRLFWRQSRDRGWLRFFWFNSAGRIIFQLLISRIAPLTLVDQTKNESLSR